MLCSWSVTSAASLRVFHRLLLAHKILETIWNQKNKIRVGQNVRDCYTAHMKQKFSFNNYHETQKSKQKDHETHSLRSKFSYYYFGKFCWFGNSLKYYIHAAESFKNLLPKCQLSSSKCIGLIHLKIHSLKKDYWHCFFIQTTLFFPMKNWSTYFQGKYWPHEKNLNLNGFRTSSHIKLFL